MEKILIIIGAYILGSIPFGWIIPKIFHNKDMLVVGSGNIGFANVLRECGPITASVVLFFDVLKGYLPIHIVNTLMLGPDWQIIAGIGALLGHCFSVFLKFRGGKAVAATLGVLIGLGMWKIGLCGFTMWFLMVLLFKYSSLGSLLGITTVAILTIIYNYPLSYKIFFIILTSFIYYKHKNNIINLINKKENKLDLMANINKWWVKHTK